MSSDLLQQALPGSTLVVAIDPGKVEHRVWFSTSDGGLLEEPLPHSVIGAFHEVHSAPFCVSRVPFAFVPSIRFSHCYGLPECRSRTWSATAQCRS